MTRLLLALLLCAACESTPKPKDVPQTNEAPRVEPKFDTEALIRQAEMLRDREFPSPVTVERDDAFEFSTGCVESCAADKALLTKVLFAGKAPVEPARLARFVPAENKVLWDGRSTDFVGVEIAIVAELASALDGQVAGPVAKPRSWDAYLAQAAVQRGTGVFVATLYMARKQSRRVDAERLAMRPEGIFELQLGHTRFVDGFATREGFAFVAALLRAGGWSGVELALNEPPAATHEIVRPDRYLSGDQPGAWSWPNEVVASREADGYTVEQSGIVGPAVFVEWLGQHVPNHVARTAYVAFDSDVYRSLRHPDGHWAFEWVSLWNTPSSAEQIVAALDAGLRPRADGARFTVVRQGATVAVLGESKPSSDPMVHTSALVGMLPTYAASQPRGVDFKPTPIDRLNSRPAVSSVAKSVWTDAATGIVADLAILDERWHVLPTTEPNLPWFAKHQSGAVLQYLVQPLPLLSPSFAEDAYLEEVTKKFAESMVGDVPVRVTRTDIPAAGSLLIEAQGRIRDRGADAPVALRANHFVSGPFVMTVSLQAPVEQAAPLALVVDALVSSIKLPEVAHQKQGGFIQFEVEE